MNKKIIISGGAVITVIIIGVLLFANKATAPDGNDVVRAPNGGIITPPVLRPDPPKLAGRVLVGTKTKTKFYLARDGKRYVFPDETKTFDTWFPNAATAPITRVTQDQLESYPLGGNVWYRPGVRLIHISTDQHIYVVAHGGVLRAINEGQLDLIYEKNWKSKLDLLQDFYFTNYTIGEPVLAANQYSPEIEMGLSQTIDQDKGL